jgi:conjugal transfer pilus assembly protein TraB
MTENFTSGMASGASSALDRLSQYYIDRAEQLQPVIQIAAGQVVDIVFTEGTLIGSQTIKHDIQQSREASLSDSTSSQPLSQQEGL